MLLTARVILAIVGVLTVLAGLAMVLINGYRLFGLLTVLGGAAIVFALLYERNRYRSAASDAANEPSGPGGGEPGGIAPPGFRPTNEVFVDPTSGQRMRVYTQQASGARRYVAEGLVDGGDHA